MSNRYLTTCVYSEKDLSCPIFNIGYILEVAETDLRERNRIMEQVKP